MCNDVVVLCTAAVQIRGAVLRLLQLLPIDVADGLRKEQLKKSGLGKVVMFLYRLPDESLENRRRAKVVSPLCCFALHATACLACAGTASRG
jgi:hypothetical protein